MPKQLEEEVEAVLHRAGWKIPLLEFHAESLVVKFSTWTSIV